VKAVVHTVINFWILVIAGVLSLAEELFASQERLFSNESFTLNVRQSYVFTSVQLRPVQLDIEILFIKMLALLDCHI